jgi:hypothetical protein
MTGETMESDLNSILMYIGAAISIFGGLSGLIVGDYYTRKAVRQKKLTRSEFKKGTILFTITSFVAVAGITGSVLLLGILDPEPISVTGVIVTIICLIGGLPALGTGIFISEFRSKGWVEKEK